MSGVKKNVFSAVVKLSKDGELRTQHGNRFHAAWTCDDECTSAELCPRPLNYNKVAANRRPSSTFNNMKISIYPNLVLTLGPHVKVNVG